VTTLLEVKNLKVEFKVDKGVVQAVNGVSYTLAEGETLGVVGESGCGKSVHALSLMKLIPEPPGRIADGEVLFEGQNLLKYSQERMESVRGKEIAMIFQDPMTSLNWQW
jgi:ABC-type dipeptide/oligopeptide/nickel transport system ATPase component